MSGDRVCTTPGQRRTSTALNPGGIVEQGIDLPGSLRDPLCELEIELQTRASLSPPRDEAQSAVHLAPGRDELRTRSRTAVSRERTSSGMRGVTSR